MLKTINVRHTNNNVTVASQPHSTRAQGFVSSSSCEHHSNFNYDFPHIYAFDLLAEQSKRDVKYCNTESRAHMTKPEKVKCISANKCRFAHHTHTQTLGGILFVGLLN